MNLVKNKHVIVSVNLEGNTEAYFKDDITEYVEVSPEGDAITSTVKFMSNEYKRLISVARYTQGSYK